MLLQKKKIDKLFISLISIFIFVLFYLISITPGLKGDLEQSLRILFKQPVLLKSKPIKKNTFFDYSSKIFYAIENQLLNETNFENIKINIKFSELEKLIAHNNIPIIVTNIGDDRFDEMAVNRSGKNKKGDTRVPVIKVPKIAAQYSFPLNVLVTEKFIKILKDKNDSNHYNKTFSVALRPPSAEVF